MHSAYLFDDSLSGVVVVVWLSSGAVVSGVAGVAVVAIVTIIVFMVVVLLALVSSHDVGRVSLVFVAALFFAPRFEQIHLLLRSVVRSFDGCLVEESFDQFLVVYLEFMDAVLPVSFEPENVEEFETMDLVERYQL